MSTVTLRTTSPQPAGGIPDIQPTAIVPTADTAPVPYTAPSDGAVGEWDAHDIRHPKLVLVPGVGHYKELFNEGDVILNEVLLLPAPRKAATNAAVPAGSFRFVPLQIRKSWKEYISADDYKAGKKPRYARETSEVIKLGGTTAWGPNGEKPTWSESGACVMLIEAPDSPEAQENPVFSIELDGKFYAQALFYASGASFNAFFVPVFTAYNNQLVEQTTDAEGKIVRSKKLWLRNWQWKTGTTKWGKQNPFVPSLLLKEPITPAVREYIQTIIPQ